MTVFRSFWLQPTQAVLARNHLGPGGLVRLYRSDSSEEVEILRMAQTLAGKLHGGLGQIWHSCRRRSGSSARGFAPRITFSRWSDLLWSIALFDEIFVAQHWPLVSCEWNRWRIAGCFPALCW